MAAAIVARVAIEAADKPVRVKLTGAHRRAEVDHRRHGLLIENAVGDDQLIANRKIAGCDAVVLCADTIIALSHSQPNED